VALSRTIRETAGGERKRPGPWPCSDTNGDEGAPNLQIKKLLIRGQYSDQCTRENDSQGRSSKGGYVVVHVRAGIAGREAPLQDSSLKEGQRRGNYARRRLREAGWFVLNPQTERRARFALLLEPDKHGVTAAAGC